MSQFFVKNKRGQQIGDPYDDFLDARHVADKIIGGMFVYRDDGVLMSGPYGSRKSMPNDYTPRPKKVPA